MLALKLEGGKRVGFLGPNGAGKTTALKLLTNMLFPTERECFVNGVSVQRVELAEQAGLDGEVPGEEEADMAGESGESPRPSRMRPFRKGLPSCSPIF